jgi:hypothetical protein
MLGENDIDESIHVNDTLTEDWLVETVYCIVVEVKNDIDDWI